MPTVAYGSDCATSSSPYVGACGHDGPGEALAHIYGPLAAKNEAPSGARHDRILVLYPQAVATRGSNPNGCWDW